MKIVEDIEKEYEAYEIKSNYVESAEDFAAFIEVGIDDVDEQLNSILIEIRENCKQEKLAKVRNFFLGLFQIEEVEYYSEDNKILEEIIELIMKYREYYQRTLATVNQENFKELTRLVDFSCEYYNQHVDYFESKRDSLEYSYKGIQYRTNLENEITQFDEFFNRKMKQYGENKAVEKNKKI